MKKMFSQYASAYSPELIMPLLNKVFSKAGIQVVSSVLQLYYLVRSPEVPLWAKTAICASLGYFIVTPDAIPDVAPVLGFTDDLAVLTTALASVASYLTPEMREKVKARLQAWFGDEAGAELSDVEKPGLLQGEMEDRV